MLIDKGYQNSQQPVAGYGLDFPSASYAISTMERFTGRKQAEAIWQETCSKLGIGEATQQVSELERIYRDLSNHKGSVGVLGRSLVIRLIAYRSLKDKNHQ